MSASAPFVITRVVAAPRARVWQAWTEVEHLQHWWGPKGFVVAHCTVDLRPGGLMHYRLRSPEGGEMWGRFLYREIVKPEKLVWVNSFSDEQGGVTRHPMAPAPRPRRCSTAWSRAGARRSIGCATAAGRLPEARIQVTT